nr:hypothetical protein [Salinispora arenicola]
MVEPGNASEVAKAFAAALDDFLGRLINDILSGGVVTNRPLPPTQSCQAR